MSINFNQLAFDTKNEIFSRLDKRELVRVGRVCKEWHEISTSADLWDKNFENMEIERGNFEECTQRIEFCQAVKQAMKSETCAISLENLLNSEDKVALCTEIETRKFPHAKEMKELIQNLEKHEAYLSCFLNFTTDEQVWIIVKKISVIIEMRKVFFKALKVNDVSCKYSEVISSLCISTRVFKAVSREFIPVVLNKDYQRHLDRLLKETENLSFEDDVLGCHHGKEQSLLLITNIVDVARELSSEDAVNYIMRFDNLKNEFSRKYMNEFSRNYKILETLFDEYVDMDTKIAAYEHYRSQEEHESQRFLE